MLKNELQKAYDNQLDKVYRLNTELSMKESVIQKLLKENQTLKERDKQLETLSEILEAYVNSYCMQEIKETYTDFNAGAENYNYRKQIKDTDLARFIEQLYIKSQRPVVYKNEAYFKGF